MKSLLLVFVLFVLNLLPASLFAEDISDKSGRWAVRTQTQTECDWNRMSCSGDYAYRIQVSDLKNGKSYELEFNSRIARIDHLKIYGNKLFFVGGSKMEHRAMVVDLSRGEIVDRIQGWHFHLSSSGRYLIWTPWYARMTPSEYTPSGVLLYDMKATPEQNSYVFAEVFKPSREHGIPLIPVKYREQPDSNDFGLAGMEHPTWLDNDNQLVFVWQDKKGKPSLVIVNLKKGGLKTRVCRVPLQDKNNTLRGRMWVGNLKIDDKDNAVITIKKDRTEKNYTVSNVGNRCRH